jgi:heme-degrading monooxygenase HmoA
MLAMIFEYRFDPDDPDVRETYQRISAWVRQELDGLDGFHGVERFQSCSDPDKYVAFGFFEDEESVRRWREQPLHRRAQTLGRTRLFTDYRLRMAQVVRDYGPRSREQAPADSQAAHGVARDR